LLTGPASAQGLDLTPAEAVTICQTWRDDRMMVDARLVGWPSLEIQVILN